MSQESPTTHADSSPSGAAHSAFKETVEKFSGGYRSVGAMVHEVLRESILTGAFAPGERLRQEMLAEVIGVSRLPIRSALIQLESEGLVEFHERRGAVVKTLSEAQVREIYELRIVLETYGVRCAMSSKTSERQALLAELAESADAKSEGPEFMKSRERFDRVLFDAENRPLLWQTLEDLKLKVGGYLLGRRLGGAHGNSHAELVALMAQGDEEGAVRSLREHLSTVCEGVVRMVNDAAAATK